jgi:GxxExxY protein
MQWIEARAASVAAGGFKGVKLYCGYRMDLVVEKVVVIEFKTLPVHESQLLSYLKLSGLAVGR